jgi:hypothetical protein
MPTRSDQGWITLRELDQRAGYPKGSAFKAFKALRPRLEDGRDFRRLDAMGDAQEIAALREGGRIYPSSIHVVLVSAGCAERLLRRID